MKLFFTAFLLGLVFSAEAGNQIHAFTRVKYEHLIITSPSMRLNGVKVSFINDAETAEGLCMAFGGSGVFKVNTTREDEVLIKVRINPENTKVWTVHDDRIISEVYCGR